MRRIDIAGQWRRFQILILSCGRLQIRRNGLLLISVFKIFLFPFIV